MKKVDHQHKVKTILEKKDVQFEEASISDDERSVETVILDPIQQPEEMECMPQDGQEFEANF